MMRLLPVIALSAALAVVLAMGGRPAAGQGAAEPKGPDEITSKAQAAIEKGLACLAASQGEDGAYPLYNKEGNPGITGLAGLAFMAGGSVPGRGKYGPNVEKALEYVLKNVRHDGFITAGNSRMYEHGFATLFLAEVYGMTGNPTVKEQLGLAVQLIEGTQNAEGGWRYNPVPMDADISVTICQIMALRAARNAGIQVSKRVIDNGVKYVRRCQNPDGGFSYVAGTAGSGFARTAAGVCSLYYSGDYESEGLRKGLDYLFVNMKGAISGGTEGHFHYAHYYAVQAMFQAGGKYWDGYYPAVRDQLVKTQQADGSWPNVGFGGGGNAYSNAMSCIILQVPYRYLPVLQR